MKYRDDSMARDRLCLLGIHRVSRSHGRFISAPVGKFLGHNNASSLFSRHPGVSSPTLLCFITTPSYAPFFSPLFFRPSFSVFSCVLCVAIRRHTTVHKSPRRTCRIFLLRMCSVNLVVCKRERLPTFRKAFGSGDKCRESEKGVFGVEVWRKFIEVGFWGEIDVRHLRIVFRFFFKSFGKFWVMRW